MKGSGVCLPCVKPCASSSASCEHHVNRAGMVCTSKPNALLVDEGRQGHPPRLSGKFRSGWITITGDSIKMSKRETNLKSIVRTDRFL